MLAFGLVPTIAVVSKWLVVGKILVTIGGGLVTIDQAVYRIKQERKSNNK